MWTDTAAGFVVIRLWGFTCRTRVGAVALAESTVVSLVRRAFRAVIGACTLTCVRVIDIWAGTSMSFWRALTLATCAVEELRSFAFLHIGAPALALFAVKNLRGCAFLLFDANAAASFVVPFLSF